MLFPPEALLLDAAVAASSRLPDDGSGVHTVAAAVMDVDGRVHTGVNVHHFTGGPCAELVALGVAAAAGGIPVAGIVAVGDGGRGVLAPCGRCRQVLIDQHPDAHVVVPDGADLVAVPARELLPYAYERRGAAPPRLLRFNPRHWDAVVAGTKTATTRFADPAAPGPVTLLFEFDDRLRSLPGVVEPVEQTPFAEITDEQAALEACTADQLRDALRTHHYPAIGDGDVIDVVRFRVADTPGR
ncbi:ASCH domain-containing protein [Krasilnikoviella flava]|uniref:Cytidine deaminase n=1 Tax=Krasilnikoviella flava TaxID=526729 RepID=A0A1T5JF45_9MICO|nr:ASCH domain-containing protein [Krasilnikoviella flava]SKC49984.1 cytidine deaminase [Krasilnikoviella flava]